MRHIISADQYTHPQLEELFSSADEMRQLDWGTLDARRQLAQRHLGRQFISLFYEASTRTRTSFELAALKLGLGLTGTENAREFSSAAKGETLADTIRVMNEYHADILVLRYHEIGGAAIAAEYAADHMTIINAGDGKGEHPTQALLDAYTIDQHNKKPGNGKILSDMNIVLGGDLRQGRTARSLAKLLANYPNNNFTFVSAPGFEMGDDIKQYLEARRTAWQETTEVEDTLRQADVVYWTRLQRERLDENEQVQDEHFVIDRSLVDVMKPDAILLHPLPRVGEITPDVDTDPRAQYFRQAGNGLYVRMALIDQILKS